MLELLRWMCVQGTSHSPSPVNILDCNRPHHSKRGIVFLVIRALFVHVSGYQLSTPWRMAPQQYRKKNTIHLAETSLRAAARDREDVYSLSALAQLLADLGRNDEAAALFERAIAGHDDEGSSCDETLGLAMGWYAALVEGDGAAGEAKAEELYRRALGMNERDPLALGNYAVFLHRIRRDHPAASVAYKKAVEAHPTHASILCKYGGFVKHVENDHQKARELFEAAIATNPSHAESLGNLAVLLHGQPGSGKAGLDRIEGLYKRALHADPANANNFSNYGLFLAERRSDVAGAEALYKKAAAIDPFHANSIYNYAVLLDGSLKQQERAEAMYRRCLEVNPEHGYALYNLAVLKEEITKDGDYSESKDLFERAVRASPTDALTRADYGRFLALVEKNFDGAVENLREAIRCDPDCTAAQFNLGKFLLHRHLMESQRTYAEVGRGTVGGGEDVDEAKGLLRRVLDDHGDHSGAHLCLGRILAEEQDYGEAATHCESALKAGCTDVEAISDLASLLAEHGRSSSVINIADDLFRRATSLSPTSESLLRRHLLFLRDVKKDKYQSGIVSAVLKSVSGRS